MAVGPFSLRQILPVSVRGTVTLPSSSYSGAQETRRVLFFPYVQDYGRQSFGVLQWESESETSA